MRKILSFVPWLALAMLTVLATPLAPAQGFNPAQAPPWVYADNFGRWVLPEQQPNTYTFQVSGVSPCQITKLNYGDGQTFYAFGNTVALAPVFVRDTNAANSEIVAPGSYLAPTQQSCGPGIAPSNPHSTFWLQSGTAGLQEAINAVGGFTASYPTVIYLTPEWYKLVSQISSQNSTLASTTPASIIAAAVGSVQAIVVDVTTAPPTQYVWKGSSTKYASGTQYWAFSATHPTLAAGTGAGTSPTVAIVGNSITGTVTVTTGSAVPVAADPIFTLTWPSPGTAGSASSGWAYAPTCTFTSTGISPGVTTNTAVAGPPAVARLTSPAAGLTSSTPGYAWTYLCH